MNPTPLNTFTYGSQNHRLLERLKEGPITNTEIVRDLGILKYTGRLSDIRAKIESLGFRIVFTPLGNGLNEYRLAWVYVPPPPLTVELPEGRYRDSKDILRQGRLF